MKLIIQDIIGVSISVLHAHHYLEVWRYLTEQAVFKNDNSSKEERFSQAMSRLSAEEKAVVAMWSPGEWLKDITDENFSTYVEGLREWINNVPLFTIYVPFELPREELVGFSEFLRSDNDKERLLEVKVDPNMIGGCAFIVDGVFYDYSLHGRLRRSPEIMSDIFNSYDEQK